MEWLRIGLAAILTTALGVAALNFFVFRSQKRREAATPSYKENERKRAQSVVISIGTVTIHLVRIAGGLVASIPMFALAFFIGSGTAIPKFEAVTFYAALFFGGWIVFAWCVRITDALGEEK